MLTRYGLINKSQESRVKSQESRVKSQDATHLK